MRHSAQRYMAIREAYARLGKPRLVMKELGCSPATVRRALRFRDMGMTATQSPGGSGRGNKGGVVLPSRHPAAVNSSTMFPTQVRDVGVQSVLKEGEYSAKIGGVILKGKWRGFPVYTLTLEERATCPRSCQHWLSCYGNNSPYALRLRPGSELEKRVAGEIADLAVVHREGFAVRLHNLGDFYSVAYVCLWRKLLEDHPSLHVFGFTARSDRSDAIAVELIALVRDEPRFSIRFSDGPTDLPSTVSIRSADQKPDDAVICPEQTGQSESCSTCGLCWATAKRVAFIQH